MSAKCRRRNEMGLGTHSSRGTGEEQRGLAEEPGPRRVHPHGGRRRLRVRGAGAVGPPEPHGVAGGAEREHDAGAEGREHARADRVPAGAAQRR